MRIDVHGHLLPEPFCDMLRESDGPLRIETGSGTTSIEEGRIDSRGDEELLVHDHGAFPLADAFIDIDTHLRWMDRHDIDKQILSVSAPHPNDSAVSDDRVVDLTRAINDGFAELQDRHPDRIAGLASLPLRKPAAAIEEVDRVVSRGLAGITVPTSFRGRSLADPALEPVFRRIESAGLPVLVHPRPNEFSALLDDDEWMLTPLCAFPVDTTFHIARLIFDGFFDRHDIDFIVSHLGGALPYLAGRLERGRRIFEREDTLERSVEGYLESLYYDVISFHLPALRAAISTVGTGPLLFGTDHPFAMEAAEQTIEDVERLDLSADEEASIFGGTAADLFDLD